MKPPSFDQVIRQKEISEDTFETIQFPLWTWPGSKVIPGGTLMSIAAAAAYKTVSSDFFIDMLQAHFLSGPKYDMPLRQKVQRLSDTGRFATRVVSMEQAGAIVVHVTCMFIRKAKMDGPSMRHCVGRASTQTIESITLDDLESGRDERGPYMQFQRLPLMYTDTGTAPFKPPPQSYTYTSVAKISTTLPPDDAKIQGLGIIALSDYHVMDCVPTVNGVSFYLPAINDTTKTPTHQNFKLNTSLNHTIHFHAHDRFHADDLCYIEANSPWSEGRRGEIHSRIFNRTGKLIATCVQEAYYVMKDQKGNSKL